MKVNLHLEKYANPAFRQKKSVPYTSLLYVDAELQHLEKQGVLSPVSFSVLAALIIVTKTQNGTLWVCVDFSTGLNAALKQHHNLLPILDGLYR